MIPELAQWRKSLLDQKPYQRHETRSMPTRHLVKRTPARLLAQCLKSSRRAFLALNRSGFQNDPEHQKRRIPRQVPDSNRHALIDDDDSDHQMHTGLATDGPKTTRQEDAV